MSVFGPEIDAALRDLTERLKEEIPDLATILEEAAEIGASETEVLARVMALWKGNPDLSGKLEGAAMDSLAPLRRLSDEEVAEIMATTNGLLEPTPDRTAVRLNPTYAASLYERLQFDGDVPELRFGPMPEGGTPAVPVATSATDAVAIGAMLEKASGDVAEEMRQIERDYVASLETDQTALTLREEGYDLTPFERANLPEPAGYERGQMPAPRHLETPTGAALAALSPEQRQGAAWHFLSTTQGRRSATAAIRQIVVAGLQNGGFEVEEGDDLPMDVDADKIRAHAEWVVGMSGPRSTQAGFAFLDTAARVLLKKLESALGEAREGALVLEVVPVNTVNLREVGWAARLVSP